MNFDQARDPGNQILQQSDSSSHPSLREIARFYRAISKKTWPDTKGVTVMQDNSGKMLVCKSGPSVCA